MHYEMNFSLIINPDNRQIVGFSLVAGEQSEAESFVLSFLQAQKNRNAIFSIDDPGQNGEVRMDFIIDDCNSPEIYSVLLKKDQAERINQLLESMDRLVLLDDGFLSPGFKVILNSEKENKLEKIFIKNN